jgi:DNA-binding LacI/PurR family transcriptional regulator
MAVTIKDVARRAGVSHTTVSRALLGNSLISAATSERVRRIAMEMGYRPSAAARSLKTNRSEVLGVIVSSIDDPYFSEVLQGIENTAQQAGYSLFIGASQKDTQREHAIVQAMVEHRVEGVIICSSSFTAQQAHDFGEYGVPIVAVNNQAAEDYRYSIYHDDVAGSRQVTAHLIRLGHRTIAYIGNAASGRTNQDRLLGFREEMRSVDCPVGPDYVQLIEYGAESAIERAVRACIGLDPRPTAIVCYNDMMAIEAMNVLHRLGLDVPADVSITGFDNIVFSAYTRPALTTFDQPKRFIGEEAGRLLLSLLGNEPGSEMPAESSVRILRGKLLVRESTAALVRGI